ncbi:MAG: TlpA disulfide reductase family protein [Desulfocapsaceae bacterium]|nr:TlpA disulfide reductase family protein [Desulfocapsaceae bacterium]
MVILATPLLAATKMPEFVLPDATNGQKIDSRSFEGMALILTFFATWCPPCIEEVPALIKLQKKYAAEGFSVIGLSVDQGGAKVVRRMIEKRAINYPVVMADAQVMQDFGGVYGIPVAFLINKEGNVVKKYTGYIPISVLEKDLQQIL